MRSISYSHFSIIAASPGTAAILAPSDDSAIFILGAASASRKYHRSVVPASPRIKDTTGCRNYGRPDTTNVPGVHGTGASASVRLRHGDIPSLFRRQKRTILFHQPLSVTLSSGSDDAPSGHVSIRTPGRMNHEGTPHLRICRRATGSRGWKGVAARLDTWYRARYGVRDNELFLSSSCFSIRGCSSCTLPEHARRPVQP